MYETDDDVRRLQELLDRTPARANPHLTSIVASARQADLHLHHANEEVVVVLEGTPTLYTSTKVASSRGARWSRACARAAGPTGSRTTLTSPHGS